VDARQERGREIAERMRVVKQDGAWIVPSQSGLPPYRVTLDDGDIHPLHLRRFRAPREALQTRFRRRVHRGAPNGD
jgi:hypothetical protein